MLEFLLLFEEGLLFVQGDLDLCSVEAAEELFGFVELAGVEFRGELVCLSGYLCCEDGLRGLGLCLCLVRGCFCIRFEIVFVQEES